MYKISKDNKRFIFNCARYYNKDRKTKTITLNYELMKSQKVTSFGVTMLVCTYRDLYRLYNKITKSIESGKRIDYKHCLSTFHQIQYELQYWWNFKKDKKYHRFWELPGCTCPTFDNLERYPTGVYYYNGSCPYHKRFVERIKKNQEKASK